MYYSIFEDVSYSASSLDDPHIVKVLDLYAKENRRSLEDVKIEVRNKVTEQTIKFSHTPKMSGTMATNLVESTVFNDYFPEGKAVRRLPKFKELEFIKLYDAVRRENPGFYDIRNVFDTLPVEPNIVFSPDADYPQYNSIDTAASSPDGTMIFNIPFMNKLIHMAHLKGVNGVGKKYVNNGGEIPDYYTYVEFLILHEFHHYLYGDHFYGKTFADNYCKENPKPGCKGKVHTILNYVGDFVINQDILERGHPQLPMGLFSKDLNFNKQKNYREIFDVIMEELENVPEDKQQDVLNEMGEQMDDHMESDDQQSGDSQDSSGSGQEQEGESGDSSGSGQDGQEGESEDSQDGSGSGQDGQEGESGDSQGGDNRQPTAGEIEDAMNDIREKMAENSAEASKRSQNNPEDNQRPDDGDNDDPDDKDKPSEHKSDGVMSANSIIKADEITGPRYNWQTIIRRMMASGRGTKETTFARVNKRKLSTIKGILIAKGSATLSPGMKEVDPTKKNIVIILDNSGSIYNALGRINKQLLNLLKGKKGEIGKVVIVRFSTGYDMHELDISTGKTEELELQESSSKLSFSKKDGGKTSTLKTLISKAEAAATHFSGPVYNLVEHLILNRSFSGVLISDSDIIWGKNKKHLIKYLAFNKKRPSSAYLLGTKEDYKKITNAIGPSNFISEI